MGDWSDFPQTHSVFSSASTDRQDTFEATAALAKRAELTFAQFVMMTPFPGTADFDRWEKSTDGEPERIEGVPITRYWLIPGHRRPKLYMPHPSMSADEIRLRTQGVWDSFYRLSEIWKRAKCAKSLKARLAFVFISKLYRQMYADTGIATDSARRKSANRWARWTGRICLRLFRGRPMPELQVPRLPEPSLTDIRVLQVGPDAGVEGVGRSRAESSHGDDWA